LMLALYRCGRSADALGCYERTRLLLGDELGIDPGPPLQRLYQQILRGDLEPAHGASHDAATGSRAENVVAPVARPVPRQLPAPPRMFVGRQGELEQLTRALQAAASGVGVSGSGGAGLSGTVVISA